MGADDWEDMSDGDGAIGRGKSDRALVEREWRVAGGRRAFVARRPGQRHASQAHLDRGAAAGDAWGDEDDWRPGPAIASPAAVRSAGRAVRPSPSRSPASRITGFGGGGRRQSRGRILKRATALAFLAGAAYASSPPARSAARGTSTRSTTTRSATTSPTPSPPTRRRRRARAATTRSHPDQARTTFGSSYAPALPRARPTAPRRDTRPPTQITTIPRRSPADRPSRARRRTRPRRARGRLHDRIPRRWTTRRRRRRAAARRRPPPPVDGRRRNAE